MPQLERRTMLKAATAAGIVWASPFVESVTAHAASVCASAQFNAATGVVTTTDPANDGLPLCPVIDGCAPSGVGSLCTCSFQAGQTTPTGGSWSGYEYTAPSGCTIVAANARIDDTLGGSGCAFSWPCESGTISTDKKTVTFTAPTSGFFWKFRMVLCCTT